MRAIETTPSTSATPTTTCSARKALDPMRHATAAATIHTARVIVPRHADVLETNEPVSTTWRVRPTGSR